jgi:hypothetical protein
MKNPIETDNRGNTSRTELKEPLKNNANISGIEAIAINPLTEPFKTSIVLIVLAVTGIAISTRRG